MIKIDRLYGHPACKVSLDKHWPCNRGALYFESNKIQLWIRFKEEATPFHLWWQPCLSSSPPHVLWKQLPLLFSGLKTPLQSKPWNRNPDLEGRWKLSRWDLDPSQNGREVQHKVRKKQSRVYIGSAPRHISIYSTAEGFVNVRWQASHWCRVPAVKGMSENPTLLLQSKELCSCRELKGDNGAPIFQPSFPSQNFKRVSHLSCALLTCDMTVGLEKWSLWCHFRHRANLLALQCRGSTVIIGHTVVGG